LWSSRLLRRRKKNLARLKSLWPKFRLWHREVRRPQRRRLRLPQHLSLKRLLKRPSLLHLSLRLQNRLQPRHLPLLKLLPLPLKFPRQQPPRRLSQSQPRHLHLLHAAW
jgi:hypothetical protein